MNDHQRETAFLLRCMRYGEGNEHLALEKEIIQIQRDEGCVQHAVWLMAVLTVLALAGLGFPAILVEHFPDNAPQLVMNLSCALGVASLISLLVFGSLGMAYRKKLNQRREDCRQLITRMLESRLGQPVASPWREGHVADGNREPVPIGVGRELSLNQTAR
jgi:hypothetical protein